MLFSKWFLRCSWGPRAESLDGCAAKTHRMIVRINEVFDKSFAWQLHHSDACKGSPTLRSVKTAVRKAVQTDTDQSSPCFIFILANHDADFPVSVSVICGEESEWVSNVVSVPMPTSEDGSMCVWPKETIVRLARELIEIWEPTHGIVTHTDFSDTLKTTGKDAEIGWITYRSDQDGVRSSISKHPEICRLVSRDLLVIPCDEIRIGVPSVTRKIKSLNRQKS